MQSSRNNMGLPGFRRESTAASRYKKLRYLCGTLALLVLALSSGWASGTPEMQSQQRVSQSRDSRLSFAFADFDGDSYPDVVTVQPELQTSSQTDYLLRLRLTTYGRRFIRLAGPNGGLKVQARDVNGDNTVDLVVATAGRNQPVAILLNDGYGNFSKVDPSAFPQAFKKSDKDWIVSAAPEADAVLLLSESSAGELPLERDSERLNRSSEYIGSDESSSVPNRPGVLRAGRAPPAITLL